MHGLVELWAGQDPDQRHVLDKALERLMWTPTGACLATEFRRAGTPARIRFELMDGTRAVAGEGTAGFHGPRGYTKWSDSQAEIALNDAYLAVDEKYRDRFLAPTLGHELLGHGLWYKRAADNGFPDVFHIHEFNELNARLVGWLIDLELNDGLGDREAWQFLKDPAAYLDELKLRHPAYALTFSSVEMADPCQTLLRRIAAGNERVSGLQVSLTRHRSWTPVIDHFIAVHGMNAGQFAALRTELALTDFRITSEIEQGQAAISAMMNGLSYYAAPQNQSITDRRKAAVQCAFFGDLTREVEKNIEDLDLRTSLIRQTAKAGLLRPDMYLPDPENAPFPDGQITFVRLVELYEGDGEHFPAARARRMSA